MRRDPDYFGDDQELELIYIAKRLKDALALEALLTERGMEYLVEPDTYSGGLIFQTQRVGAFFYVLPGMVEAARSILAENGYAPYQALDK